MKIVKEEEEVEEFRDTLYPFGEKIVLHFDDRCLKIVGVMKFYNNEDILGTGRHKCEFSFFLILLDKSAWG